MNDHDGEKLSGLLSAEGFEAVDSVDEADLVLLNTCSIREKAVHKVYSELGRLREEKQRRPLMVGVTGCLAQQEKAALFKRAPHVDFVLGTMALKQLPRLVAEVQAGKARVMDTTEYPDNHLFPPTVTRRRDTAKALVTHYVQALAMRRKAHQMGAIFGAKLPEELVKAILGANQKGEAAIAAQRREQRS